MGHNGGSQVSAGPLVGGDISPREGAGHFPQQLLEGVGPLRRCKGKPAGLKAAVKGQGQGGINLCYAHMAYELRCRPQAQSFKHGVCQSGLLG